MKKIQELEQARTVDKCLKDQGINSSFFYAYENTLETINESINFTGIVWEQDVKEIIEHCKKFNIEYFTISNAQAGIENVLALFEEEGCSIELTKVFSKYIDFKTNEPEIKNGFKVIVK